MTDLWHVQIKTVDPHNVLTCTAWLGDTAPTPSGGGGGHEIVELPRRRPVVVWRKGALWVMSVSILIDNFRDGDAGPVQQNRDDLIRMWRPLNEEDEPPIVRLDAEGDAVPLQHLQWVITNLEWGAAKANSSGNRTQQAFTVTVTEYNPDERIEALHSTPSKKRRASKSKGKTKGPKTYTVKAGDSSLSEIAQRLKIKGGWRALGDAQKPPILDPRSIRVGQQLKLP